MRLNIFMREMDILAEIISFLRQVPNLTLCRHNPTTFAKGHITKSPEYRLGTGDLILCYKSKYLEIEVKTENGKISEYQERRQIKVEKSGGYYFIVKSLLEMQTILEKF